MLDPIELKWGCLIWSSHFSVCYCNHILSNHGHPKAGNLYVGAELKIWKKSLAIGNYNYGENYSQKCGRTLGNSCVANRSPNIIVIWVFLSHCFQVILLRCPIFTYGMLYCFDNNNVHICESHECHPKHGGDTCCLKKVLNSPTI